MKKALVKITPKSIIVSIVMETMSSNYAQTLYISEVLPIAPDLRIKNYKITNVNDQIVLE